jgi:parallel beta-helix repeat protein
MKRAISGLMLTLLSLTSMLTLALNIQTVSAWSGTIYIRADGSIDPPDAPIVTYDNITYMLTDNIVSEADGIIVERDNIVIDGNGFTLEGSGAYSGIAISGRYNVTIKNVNIKNFDNGIMLSYCSNNNIIGNNITANNPYGIWLLGSSNNSIFRNNITNNYVGVWLSSSSNNNIIGNNITANFWAGIDLSHSSNNNAIVGNIFVNNGLNVWDSYQNVVKNNNVNGRPLVYLEGIADYTITDAGQIILVKCKNITAKGLNLSRTSIGIQLLETNNCFIAECNIANDVAGIWLDHSSNNTISRNNITANWLGIELENSLYNSIHGNNITANQWIGIDLGYSSSNNSIIGNNITNTSWIVIHLSYSSNNDLIGNNISNNGYCIELYYSSNNTITQNHITNNNIGIWLEYSSNNSIIGNNITNNMNGALLNYSSDNYIFHNNFVNNAWRILSFDSINVWDDGYPSGGNYWSDYPEVDYYSGPNQDLPGSDGICDAPYVISTDNLDRYPLMRPWGSNYVWVDANKNLVNDEGDYNTTSIQDAINHASDYGWIMVERGNYTENVNVNKAGLFIKAINGPELTRVSAYQEPVLWISSNDITLNGFTIIGSDYGVVVFNEYLNIVLNCTVEENVISNCSQAAVLIINCGFSSFSKNNITSNGYGGICAESLFNSTISENAIIADYWPDGSWLNWVGLHLYNSSNNTISGNTIALNWIGISLYYSSNNTIYHNDFINNTKQVLLEASVNVWDDSYPLGGNYWSNYIDVDEYNGPNQDQSGCDGIWDHPYIIDSHNRDSYPSVKMYHVYPYSLEQPFYVWNETIRIKADGSIHPQGAPIFTTDNITYTLKSDVIGEIPDSSAALEVERDNIIFEGSSHSIQSIGYSYSSGIDISERSNVTIRNVYFAGFSIGIFLNCSSNNGIIGCSTIGYNNFCAVYLLNSSNNNIKGNNFKSGSSGICLESSSSNTITENIVTGYSRIGIDISSSSKNNIISKNTITMNWYGIVLSHSSNNLLCGNTIENNMIDIYLNESSSNGLSGNHIESSSIGIDLHKSSNNDICGNIIANNCWGIRLYNASNNRIDRNNIMANWQYGIYASISLNNFIYHNNFENNAQQAYSDNNSLNIWDDGYPSGGNYWSDYTGFDLYSGSYQNEAGSDGIGDSPYIIDEYNTDRYPLMGPFDGLTLKGQNVTAYPSSEVCLIFENVTNEGATSVNVSSVGPEPSKGFMLAGNYYDIKTTANYSGTIKIRIVYDDSNMTLEKEMSLRLMQWDEALQEWVDITTYIDTENNVIFGETTHLSLFAIFAPFAPPLPIDETSPTTALTIGEPKYISDTTYVTTDTPFTLEANDNTGSGVCSIAYRIYNDSYNSGWLTYTESFYLIGLADGVYTIEFNSTDNLGNIEATKSIQVTLFSWNYIFTDSYGRGTTLKINLAHKFFQFITPDKDYGIRKATYMYVYKRTIIILHKDNELNLATVSVDTQLDFCIVYAKDRQTGKIYWLIDKTGTE